MLTTNYYNLRENNRMCSGGSYSYESTVKINKLKQFRDVNGNYLQTNTQYAGSSDPIFGNLPRYDIKYNANKSMSSRLSLGFDGSNQPATIDDYKLIEPIADMSILSTNYDYNHGTIIHEYTIKNTGNEAIINGVGLFGCFSNPTSEVHSILLYREVFASPITIPANSPFIYRLEITVGE